MTYFTYISAYKALSLSLSPVSFFQPSKLVADNAQGCWSHLRKILRCVSMKMHVSGKRARNMKTMFTILMFKKAALCLLTRAPWRGLSLTSPMNKSMSSTLKRDYHISSYHEKYNIFEISEKKNKSKPVVSCS